MLGENIYTVVKKKKKKKKKDWGKLQNKMIVYPVYVIFFAPAIYLPVYIQSLIYRESLSYLFLPVNCLSRIKRPLLQVV